MLPRLGRKTAAGAAPQQPGPGTETACKNCQAA